ncbi:hypothetical protein GQ473_03180 [archaeon]|nr:hypothetical protein [archaeon]
MMNYTINDILNMNGSEFLNGEPGIVKVYAPERLSSILYHDGNPNSINKSIDSFLAEKNKYILELPDWVILHKSEDNKYTLKHIVINNMIIQPGDLTWKNVESVLVGFVFLEDNYKELAEEYNMRCN